MDIGDLIFPLLIIGGVIVQWLTGQAEQKKKKEQGQSPARSERPDYGGEREVDPFEDLMEALGRTGTGPAGDAQSPAPVPTEQPSGPPPLTSSLEPVRPFSDSASPRIDPLERQRELLEQKRREVAQLKQTHKSPKNLFSTGLSSAAGSEVSPPRLRKIRQTLQSREATRQAIVLNEILQKPVSLR